MKDRFSLVTFVISIIVIGAVSAIAGIPESIAPPTVSVTEFEYQCEKNDYTTRFDAINECMDSDTYIVNGSQFLSQYRQCEVQAIKKSCAHVSKIATYECQVRGSDGCFWITRSRIQEVMH